MFVCVFCAPGNLLQQFQGAFKCLPSLRNRWKLNRLAKIKIERTAVSLFAHFAHSILYIVRQLLIICCWLLPSLENMTDTLCRLFTLAVWYWVHCLFCLFLREKLVWCAALHINHFRVKKDLFERKYIFTKRYHVTILLAIGMWVSQLLSQLLLRKWVRESARPMKKKKNGICAWRMKWGKYLT